MRGKGRLLAARLDNLGITPAYAGKSPGSFSCRSGPRDHPRVCGEKQRFRAVVAHCGGITPACAGKSQRERHLPEPDRDHPRVCGEKFFSPKVPTETAGSPPRVRGKVAQLVDGCCCCGITPACAGKRVLVKIFLSIFGDHPRVCGEKFQVCFAVFVVAGSPPRVRGKDHMRGMAVDIRGITPACAGKRTQLSLNLSEGGDHPRVCGEKSAH